VFTLHHPGIVFSLPLFNGIGDGSDKMVSLIRQVLYRGTQRLSRRNLGSGCLHLEVDPIDQRVRMHVTREFHLGVSKQLHPKKVADRVVFLVKSERPCVRDLGVRLIFDLFLVISEEESV